jgi:hypothetical protein
MPLLSRFSTQDPADGKRCSSRSIPALRRKGLWQKRPRSSLSWQVTGSLRPLNIGPTGVKNASSLIGLLLTPNGRVRDWFAEELHLESCQ